MQQYLSFSVHLKRLACLRKPFSFVTRVRPMLVSMKTEPAAIQRDVFFIQHCQRSVAE